MKDILALFPGGSHIQFLIALIACILQVIKTGGRNSLGTRL